MLIFWWLPELSQAFRGGGRAGSGMSQAWRMDRHKLALGPGGGLEKCRAREREGLARERGETRLWRS